MLEKLHYVDVESKDVAYASSETSFKSILYQCSTAKRVDREKTEHDTISS